MSPMVNPYKRRRVWAQSLCFLCASEHLRVRHRTDTDRGQLPKIGAGKAACFWRKGKSLRSWAEAFDVLGSLLGDAGFGCGLHLGLWRGRLLDLHWLSERGLFFAGAG